MYLLVSPSLVMGAAIAAIGVAWQPACAATIEGITFEVGAQFQLMDLAASEQIGDGNGVVDAAGERLHGVFRIARITNRQGIQTWANGDNGRALTGYFHDYVATEFLDAGGNRYIGFTGGIFDIYSDTTPDFELDGSQADDIAKATDSDAGGPWLTLAGSPILSNALPLTDLGLNLTLRSQSGQSSSMGPIDQSGLLDVIGGAVAAHFDTNMTGACDATFPHCDDADMTFDWSGQSEPTTASRPWASLGSGTIKQVFFVPEPGSLAMLSLALCGFALGLRRHR